jgi:hypothetical protein
VVLVVLKMPFESHAELDVGINVTAIENATVLSAIRQYPDDSIVDLAEKLGKSSRWVYAVKRRIRRDHDLRQLLPNDRPKQA